VSVKKYDVIIIGSGFIATNFARCLAEKNIKIAQVAHTTPWDSHWRDLILSLYANNPVTHVPEQRPPSVDFFDAKARFESPRILVAGDEKMEGKFFILATGACPIFPDVLKEKKIDKYFIHSLGHGTGLEIHELPNLSPGSKDVLANNMVFSIEPGVYFPKIGGIRIEDLVYLKNGKVQKFINVSTGLKDNIL
jgi:hypothetical protein